MTRLWWGIHLASLSVGLRGFGPIFISLCSSPNSFHCPKTSNLSSSLSPPLFWKTILLPFLQLPTRAEAIPSWYSTKFATLPHSHFLHYPHPPIRCPPLNHHNPAIVPQPWPTGTFPSIGAPSSRPRTHLSPRSFVAAVKNSRSRSGRLSVRRTWPSVAVLAPARTVLAPPSALLPTVTMRTPPASPRYVSLLIIAYRHFSLASAFSHDGSLPTSTPPLVLIPGDRSGPRVWTRISKDGHTT